MDKVTNTKSKNLTEENIAQLKQLFPSVFSEGKIDFTKLQQMLGENIEENKEYYRFTWPGKRQAVNEALKQSTGTLRPVKEDSVNWDSTQNLYIEGDNLEVLKLLQKSYYNKVKMIYIDPPYNTGKDFVYKDNYKDNLAEYNEKFNRTDEDGNITSSETNDEGNARYHSNWLNMMFPRLQLARNLLTDDGVIFMSIDDNEVSNLKRIADEIFGEGNFVAQLIWVKKKKGSHLSKTIRSMTEYVIVFSKNKELIELYGENAYSDKKQPIAKRTNSIKRLIFQKNIIRTKLDDGFYKKGKYGIGTSALLFLNDFEVKDGFVKTSIEVEGPFVWVQSKLDDELIKGTEVHLSTKFGFNVLRSDQIEKIKRPSTLIDSKVNVGTNEDAYQEAINLFHSEGIMDYPKPVSLMQYLINTITFFDKNSIILDFFSGSASTAHATMKLNAEDGGTRKFIMVQLPEVTEEDSEAYKAGYKNICEIGKERIRRAGTKIKEELIAEGKTTEAEKLDIGFKVLRLDSSNMYSWEKSPEELEQNLNLFKDSVIKSERSTEDVLYEVLLKYGLDLTYPIETITIDNKTVYSVGFGQLLICLDKGITRNTAKEMVSWIKENDIDNTQIVFDENNFTNDVEKTNAIVLFKENGINDVKSI